jgi:AcrR family transcriptional regulator
LEKLTTYERQNQIKQVVLEIIFNEGLKNLSTRRIAQKIGLSEGAIFRHFISKQAIIEAIVSDVHKTFITKLQSIANQAEAPEKRLKEFVAATVNFLADNKGITLLMFSELSNENNPLLKKKLLQIFNSQKNLVSKIVLDGISSGLWSEDIIVEDLAKLYMGIPISLNIELILQNGVLNSEAFSERMFHLMLKMLLK